MEGSKGVPRMEGSKGVLLGEGLYGDKVSGA